MTIRYCAQCKANAEAADDPDIGPAVATVYVQGTRPSYSNPDKRVPYRAYLCDDHCNIEIDDGATFPIQRRINP